MIKKLQLTTCFIDDSKNMMGCIIDPSLFPNNLKELKIISNLTINKNTLTSSLESISFDRDFVSININNLPRGINRLRTMGKTCVIYLNEDGSISSQLDDIGNASDIETFNSLKTIIFNKFSQNILEYSYLFPHLKSLVINSIDNNKPLEIPNSVEFLKFGFKYNSPIPLIPPNIKSIYFGKSIKKSFLNIDKIPDNIEFIIINNYLEFDIFNFKRFKYLKEITYYADKNDFLYKYQNINSNSKRIKRQIIKKMFNNIKIITIKKKDLEDYVIYFND